MTGESALEDEQSLHTPTAFSLETAYGSVKPSRKPEDFDALIRITKDAKAEETLRKLTES